MPFGYNGKILKVDLTTGQFSVDEHDEIWYRTYMGGANIGAYYLLNEMPPKADPYGPDNVLVFATSIVVGAPASGYNRFSVIGKSGLTGPRSATPRTSGGRRRGTSRTGFGRNTATG
jgi:aldehyde:ferredoxin oxidoreductase